MSFFKPGILLLLICTGSASAQPTVAPDPAALRVRLDAAMAAAWDSALVPAEELAGLAPR